MRVLRYPFDRPIKWSDHNYITSDVRNVKIVTDPDLGLVAKFDGSAYVKGPNLDAMTGNSKRTLAYWCKLDGLNHVFIHCTGRYKSSVWCTHIYNRRYFRLVVNGDNYSSFPTRPKTNTWHHICETYDGDYLALYVDGKRVQNKKKTVNTQNTNIYVGKKSTGGYGFKGRLSDFRVYNHSMTQEQIEALFKLDSKRLPAKEIPGKIHLRSSGSTTLSCFVEGDPAVNYRVVVDDDVIDDVKTGDTVGFEGLTPGTNYTCKLYKIS